MSLFAVLTSEGRVAAIGLNDATSAEIRGADPDAATRGATSHCCNRQIKNHVVSAKNLKV